MNVSVAKRPTPHGMSAHDIMNRYILARLDPHTMLCPHCAGGPIEVVGEGDGDKAIRQPGSITVAYDGHCRNCGRTVDIMVQVSDDEAKDVMRRAVAE